MNISVKVKPNAGKDGVERLSDGSLLVSVKSPAVEGKANKALEKTVAKHFGVAPSCVSIVSGSSSRNKRMKVLI